MKGKKKSIIVIVENVSIIFNNRESTACIETGLSKNITLVFYLFKLLVDYT